MKYLVTILLIIATGCATRHSNIPKPVESAKLVFYTDEALQFDTCIIGFSRDYPLSVIPRFALPLDSSKRRAPMADINDTIQNSLVVW
jgi:hypothetical protein